MGNEGLFDEKAGSKGNYFTGIIGAVLGSLLGVVVFVAIDRLGYVSAISGVAIAFFAGKGYKMLGGPISRAMPVIIGLTVILSALFGVLASIVIWWVTEYDAPLGEAIELMFFFLTSDFEFVGEVLLECILPLLFSILGAWATIRQLYKEGRENKKSGETVETADSFTAPSTYRRKEDPWD